MQRKILFYGNYFSKFYDDQDVKTQEKIDFVLDLIKNVDRVPVKFLKFLEGTDGMYEIRISTGRKNIRILCFFDEDRLIILVNCFIKKKNKTPGNELDKGIKLKNEYFTDKLKRSQK